MENIQLYLDNLKGYDYTGKMPVVIDFYATWCGPCMSLAPNIERLAKEYDGRIKVLKVDVDKNPSLAQAAHVMSIPTIFFIDIDGNITRSLGNMPYAQLVNNVEELLK
ncbi:MAG: redoxin domain-containing protein [Muribaculaceae bacterium]|nr:redoxin domain-containing protein [Muribaculaceae bacterium]